MHELYKQGALLLILHMPNFLVCLMCRFCFCSSVRDKFFFVFPFLDSKVRVKSTYTYPLLGYSTEHRTVAIAITELLKDAKVVLICELT